MAEGQGKSKGTTAHTEVDGGAKAAFPPFQFETFTSQLVFFAIAFGLFYIIVSRLIVPRVGNILETRQGVIDSDQTEAARLRSESDDAMKAYETALANARAKAQAIAAEVREKLNADQEKEKSVLEASLASKIAAAETTIASMREQAMGNVRSIAADTASAIVERLTGTTPNASAVNSALDASLKG